MPTVALMVGDAGRMWAGIAAKVGAGEGKNCRV